MYPAINNVMKQIMLKVAGVVLTISLLIEKVELSTFMGLGHNLGAEDYLLPVS